MFALKLIIYFICFFIVVHFVLHFFDIDIFELFETADEKANPTCSVEISDSIDDLEKSIQELKEVSSI